MSYRWTLTNLSNMDTEVLTKDPIGWDEGVYNIKRSEAYKGVFHKYTTTLKFHCNGGGKEFIESIYSAEDINATIDVLCEYDCDGSGNYDELFTGVLNLSTYKNDGEHTSINIETSSLLTKLYNRDKISVDLESTESIGKETITAPTPYTLEMLGAHIILENNYGASTDSSSAEVFYNIDGTSGGSLGTKTLYVKPALQINSSALGGLEYAPFLQQPEVDNEVDPIYHFISDPLQTPSPLHLTFQVSVQGQYQDVRGSSMCADTHLHCHNLKMVLAVGDDWASRVEYVLKDYDTTPGDNDVYTLNLNSPVPHFVTLDFTGAGGVNINDDQYMWLYFLKEAEAYADITCPCLVGVPFHVSTYSRFQITDSYFNMWADTTFADTEAKTMLVHEAFNQVVDSIADSDGNFYSEFFGRTDSEKQTYAEDGCGSGIAITNGLNIRSFDDKKIYCTFSDLFNSMDAVYNLGVGYLAGKIRVEPLSFFFDGATKVITLANVNNFITENAYSKYINHTKIGYQKWETEVRGGLDEPCTQHEYSTIINSIDTEYQKLSKYIASSYAIELTRRKNKLFHSDFDDWRYDNDNFLVAVIRAASGYADVFLPEKRVDSFTDAIGMVGVESAFNLRLTPARMILAHLNVINAGLQKINGDVSFVRGDGNTALSLKKTNDGCQEDYSGQSLDENQSFAWNDSNVANIAPIWLPEIYSFEYPLTYQQFKAIKANPYGYIEFYKFADEIKSGFILNMEYKMKGGKTKFELLKRYQ